MTVCDNGSEKEKIGTVSIQQQILGFEPQLRAYAMSLSRSADKSDDLVQETMLRAISKIETFRPGTNLGAWLTTILRNCYLSDLRRRRNEVEDADGCYSESLRAAPEQEAVLEYKEFWTALREIPFDQREALLLVGAAGLSYEDTAMLCRTTTGTANQLIPDVIRAFLGDRPCRIRSPSAIRPWQFVLMPLHGYLLLCERLAEDGARFATGWNFGPMEENARPVSWIADKLVTLWGEGASWMHDRGAHPAEAHVLRLDTSKAKSDLDWHPVLQLEQSLVWIVEWYHAFQARGDLQSITRRQIERYEYLLQDHCGRNATGAPRKTAAKVQLLPMIDG